MENSNSAKQKRTRPVGAGRQKMGVVMLTVKVTYEMRDYLKTMDNQSAHVRELLEKDMIKNGFSPSMYPLTLDEVGFYSKPAIDKQAAIRADSQD